ncbi:MAG: DoxX family protein [Cyanobacteriota bacterium]|nr:DoxX family protein [Cyanobacteriota bacterium]
MTLFQRSLTWLTYLLKFDSVPLSVSHWGWLLLRVVAGLVMIHNGLDKLEDIQGFATAYVEVIGLPYPVFFAYLAAYTELLAAPLLALGLWVRPAGLALFSTMAVAIFHHVKVAGFNIPYLELSSLYAACFLAFAMNGGGLFSLDYLLAAWIDQQLASQQLSQHLATTTSGQKPLRQVDPEMATPANS